jgi:hypothetical protein
MNPNQALWEKGDFTRIAKTMGGRVVMGNWIPVDPTLVAQILKISSAYSPPPPEGFVSPMTWGVESHVLERFAARHLHLRLRLRRRARAVRRRVPPRLRTDDERLRCRREERSSRRPPGRARSALREPEQSGSDGQTPVPATFLRVTGKVH